MKRIFNQVVITLLASAALASAQQPILRLSSTTVAATVSQGSNAPNQSVLAYNVGSGTLSIGAISTASWVQIALTPSAACTQSTNGCFPIVLTFNTSALAAGTYSALIEVSDPNAVDAPQSIAVSLNVASVPTTLTFYAPPNGGASTATFYTHGPATTQVSTATGGPWLSVQLETTTAAAFVPYQVTANAANISTPGTYTGSVVVSGSDAAPDNHSVAITLNVTTSPIAQLSIPALTIPLGQNQQESIPITVGNIGGGSLTLSGATATTTTGSGWLTAVVAAGSVTVTFNTASLSPGVYTGSVAITTNAVNNSALTVPVTLLVTQQTGPQIGFGGVVDDAAFQPTLAPGGIAAAFGLGLSSATGGASSLPLPTTLNGTSVLVNGEAAPLYFTSSGQINFQVPYEIPAGLATVQVVNGATLGNTVSMSVADRAPRIPLLSGIAPVIINYGDNSVPVVTNPALPLASHPAALGDTLIIYAFGLGQTDPIATDGVAASGSPLLQIDPPVNVMLTGGGVFGQSLQVTPLFTGLVPGLVGLYQINFTIPQNAPTGTSVGLTLNVKGGSTNPVNIAIQ